METVRKLVKPELLEMFQDYLEGLKSEELLGLQVVTEILSSKGESNLNDLFPEEKSNIQEDFQHLSQK